MDTISERATNPRRILGLAEAATAADIQAAYERLVLQERRTWGGYAQRIERLTAARDALLGSADGL
jgi:hypothetical protein